VQGALLVESELMSPRPTFDSVRAFLGGPQRAVLATLRPAGDPHVVVVDYLVLDDGLLLNGRRDRRWVANLRRDPCATALVHDPDDVDHWVSVGGRVELVREGDEASVEDAKTMARRYGDDPGQFDGQHRVTWRLVPERVFERAT
jgi:PPOX class probable F420-dependent enzyme